MYAFGTGRVSIATQDEIDLMAFRLRQAQERLEFVSRLFGALVRECRLESDAVRGLMRAIDEQRVESESIAVQVGVLRAEVHAS